MDFENNKTLKFLRIRKNQPPIFINYRRILSKAEAMNIKRELEKLLGEGAVFLDYENIIPGEYWEEKLELHLGKAKVLLCLIPANWVETSHPDFGGRRRVDLPHDWVRREIEYCLKNGKPIIPVLLEGGRFPRKDDLPSGLGDFVRYQHTAQEIKMENLAYDLRKVVDAIKRLGIDFSESHIPLTVSRKFETDSSLEELYPLPGRHRSLLRSIEKPYVGLRYFEENEASIYFGRDKDILRLINKITQPGYRLFLMYGASGVGKSSMLNAGLTPRIRRFYDVKKPQRRDYFIGLDQQLRQQLKERREEKPHRPQLIILDQVEEMFTNKNPKHPDEARNFFALLSEELYQPNDARFLLIFRVEHLAKIRNPLEDRGHAMEDFEMLPLNAAGVRQAVEGVVGIKKFNLQISQAFVTNMMEQVRQDEESHIAPLLQLQLRSMWDEAFLLDPRNPTFDETLHKRFQKISLPKMIDMRLNELPDQFQVYLSNGLVLDFLNHLITERLTAGADTLYNINDRYRHIPDLDLFLEAMINTYLVIRLDDSDSLRLAHDSLAPIIKQKFQESEQAGQRAWRILSAKTRDLLKDRSISFSESDVKIILEGISGMPAMDDFVKTKILKRKQDYLDQHERNFQLAFKAAEKDTDNLNFQDAIQNLTTAKNEDLHREQVLSKAKELLYPLSILKYKVKVDEALQLIISMFKGRRAVWKTLNDRVINLPEEHLFSEVQEYLQKHDPALHEKMRNRFFPAIRKIPGGTFEMGPKGKELYFYRLEEPAHTVRIDAFRMADTPTTFWQYGLYCLATGRNLPRDSGFGRGDKPVINVSWYDAVAYANWLSLQCGLRPVYRLEKIPYDPNDFHRNEKIDWTAAPDWQADGFRLPTEAEWEFAAGAILGKDMETGSEIKKRRFGNGKNVADPSEINFDASTITNKEAVEKGWMREIRKDLFHAETKPVRFFAETDENPFGLFDMSGNVFEWCWDRFNGLVSEPDQYFIECQKKGVVPNPRGVSAGSRRVIRGGSWGSHAPACRTAHRYAAIASNRYDTMGFRLARRGD